MGNWNNDYDCSETGHLKCIDIFFGFNHPIHREVENSDLTKVLLKNVEKSISFSDLKSTQKTNYQSGDF